MSARYKQRNVRKQANFLMPTHCRCSRVRASSHPLSSSTLRICDSFAAGPCLHDISNKTSGSQQEAVNNDQDCLCRKFYRGAEVRVEAIPVSSHPLSSLTLRICDCCFLVAVSVCVLLKGVCSSCRGPVYASYRLLLTWGRVGVKAGCAT